MKHKQALWLLLFLLVSVAFVLAGDTASPNPPPGDKTQAKTLTVGGDYVGSDTCVTCHDDQEPVLRTR